MESTTKTITMREDGTGGDGESLKAGETYTLASASADHWIKRGKADVAGDKSAKTKKKAAADKEDEKPTTDASGSDSLRREPPAIFGTRDNVFTPEKPAGADKPAEG